jgi:hypothetical protein
VLAASLRVQTDARRYQKRTIPRHSPGSGFLAFGVSLGSTLHLNGPFDESLRRPSRANFQFDQASIQMTILLKISWFCAGSFTDNQETRLRKSKSGTAL